MLERIINLCANHGLGALKISDVLMAYAQAKLNWSDTNENHANQFGVSENLSWGGTNPFNGWCVKEKKYFEDAVASGNYPNLAELATQSNAAYAISAAYPSLYPSVGHYLNIVNAYYNGFKFQLNAVAGYNANWRTATGTIKIV